MKSTLDQVVDAVIKKFIAGKKEFSAHDVTQDIRGMVNSGLLEIDGRTPETVMVDGVLALTVKIEHSEIRNLVADKLRNNTEVDRSHNGQFWIYKAVEQKTKQTNSVVNPSGKTWLTKLFGKVKFKN